MSLQSQAESIERQRELLGEAASLVEIACGSRCPECGNTVENEDNGCAGHWLEFRCKACDHRWGPGTEA